MTENEPGISSAAAARLVCVTRSTMAVWRSRGTGPPVHYAGSKPVYFASEVRAWMESCTALMRREREEHAAEAAQYGGRRRGRPKSSVGLIVGRPEGGSS
jgi:hypothetical protein